MIEKCEICGQVGNEVKIVDPTEPTGIKTLPNPCKWNNESHAWICEDCAYECRDDIVTAVNEQRCERANVQIEAGKYAYACGYYD